MIFKQTITVLIVLLLFNQPTFAERVRSVEDAQEYLSKKISDILKKKVENGAIESDASIGIRGILYDGKHTPLSEKIEYALGEHFINDSGFTVYDRSSDLMGTLEKEIKEQNTNFNYDQFNAIPAGHFSAIDILITGKITVSDDVSVVVTALTVKKAGKIATARVEIKKLAAGNYLVLSDEEKKPKKQGVNTEKTTQNLKPNKFGIKFIPIPAGSFRMGDIQGVGYYSWEKPVHHVNIKAFYISETEITQQQWQAVMGNNPSEFKNGDNYPVEKVSWNDVQDYIQELNHQTGNHYRLPSEAEWEYAARAGSNTKYSWGNYITHNRANYGKDECCEGLAEGKDKWVTTSPVASFTPNAFGLYDMAGNVREWTQDCWNETYAKAPTDGSAWESGNCAERVERGGSYYSTPTTLRSADRYKSVVSKRKHKIGFRLIQDRNP